MQERSVTLLICVLGNQSIFLRALAKQKIPLTYLCCFSSGRLAYNLFKNVLIFIESISAVVKNSSFIKLDCGVDSVIYKCAVCVLGFQNIRREKQNTNRFSSEL